MNKVNIRSYSGDEEITVREYDINDYYDADIPEIDDGDYIVSHRISRVEISMYEDNEKTTHINYYDENGRLYRTDNIINGECEIEML